MTILLRISATSLFYIIVLNAYSSFVIIMDNKIGVKQYNNSRKEKENSRRGQRKVGKRTTWTAGL
jgi:hypothetical protein